MKIKGSGSSHPTSPLVPTHQAGLTAQGLPLLRISWGGTAGAVAELWADGSTDREPYAGKREGRASLFSEIPNLPRFSASWSRPFNTLA
jgi:hypothetical protein